MKICLIKGLPCDWKCAFCNYIEDNTTDENLINSVNTEVLSNVTGWI